VRKVCKKTGKGKFLKILKREEDEMDIGFLRTDKNGKFEVFNMYDDNNPVRIVLPHRVSLSLFRLENFLVIDCDLGHTPGDDIRVCEINTSKKEYTEAVRMNPKFMSIARSFESSFCVDRFIDAYAVKNYEHVSAGMFGRDRVDQVWINLAPDMRLKTNIEFSVFKNDYVNLFGNEHKLDEPAMTLVGSLKLHGLKAHYFLFVEWWGDNPWRYSKNFFYNNTAFVPPGTITA